ncbi:MAG: hypothetical protein ACYC6Y_06675, partial [Thermoguttaceae bacterium]
MSGTDFSIRVESVEYVHGYAKSGGKDRAELHGTDGDELFVGKATWTRLSGAGYALRTKFFDEVSAYAGAGTDTASLEDSAGDDTFYATPAQATVLGQGYIHRAMGFDAAHGYARNGGYDIANLHDSAGDDRYVGADAWGKLVGSGFQVRAKFFDSIHAYADGGGQDSALLLGTSGTDLFDSYATHSWLRGQGYEHWVGAFDAVYARASTGADEALIHGSDGSDQVVVEDRTVTLTELQGGAVRQAMGFNTVTTKLRRNGDEVAAVGSPGIDSRIQWLGEVAVVYAADFLDPASPSLGFQAAID